MNYGRSLIIAFMAVMPMLTMAQMPRFAYTNVDYILAYMPESQVVQSQLNEYERQLIVNIQSKYQTLSQKMQDLEANSATMIDAVRAERENEIRALQAEVDQLSRNSEQMMAQKQSQLLAPLYDKIQEAIDAVAEENGYDWVMNSSSLLHAPEGADISDLVLKKLGVEPPSGE